MKQENAQTTAAGMMHFTALMQIAIIEAIKVIKGAPDLIVIAMTPFL